MREKVSSGTGIKIHLCEYTLSNRRLMPGLAVKAIPITASSTFFWFQGYETIRLCLESAEFYFSKLA